MEALIPFMLFLLQPPAGDADAPVLVRHPAVFETEELCLEAAEALRAKRQGDEGTALHSYCVEMPGPEEFRAMLKSIEARVAGERKGAQ